MRRTKAWLMLVTAVVMVSCTSSPTLVGPKPRDGYEVLGRASGSGCGLALFGVIPLGVNSRTERAYQEALKRGGTGLIETELQNQWWWVPFLGLVYCTAIRGTEVR
jgi:hypothetical protein